MRILGKDVKGKAYKLMIDNLDDLWHLYNLIEAHDVVGGETYRRMEKAGDKVRPEKTEKKRVWLAIDVEHVEFHEFSNRLRVHGLLVRGPEEIGLKSYHTLNFQTGGRLELEKPEPWRKHQLEQLENAITASNQPQVTIVALEDDNAVITQLYQYGVRKIASIDRQGSGKMYSDPTNSSINKVTVKCSDSKKEFFNNILLQLQQARPEDSPLIIVGPGFTKDDFVKFAKEKSLTEFSNVLMENTGQAGMVGVQEAIKRGVVKRLVENSRVAFETELVEHLLEEIAKDGPATYGVSETEQAVEVGAVETLLVIDKLIRGPHEQIDKLLKNTETSAGKIVIISSLHDAGKQLDALGGVAALLRYKI